MGYGFFCHPCRRLISRLIEIEDLDSPKSKVAPRPMTQIWFAECQHRLHVPSNYVAKERCTNDGRMNRSSRPKPVCLLNLDQLRNATPMIPSAGRTVAAEMTCPCVFQAKDVPAV